MPNAIGAVQLELDGDRELLGPIQFHFKLEVIRQSITRLSK